MDKQSVKEWLSQQPPEVQAEFGIGQRQDDVDEYASSIIARAKKELMDEIGGAVGESAVFTAMSKFTQGLPDKAQEILRERLKDKPVGHLMALANDESYLAMVRESAEFGAAKALEVEEAKKAEATEVGDGKKESVTAEAQAFQKQMKESMGVDFTDEEAAQAVKELSDAPKEVL